MVKVANIVFNSFINDSRVLKESISLSNNGYEVEVIAHGDKELSREEIKENFKIKRFSYLDRRVDNSKKNKIKVYINWTKEVVDYVKEFDILHCNDLNTMPIAFIVKKFYKKDIKIVYDAHEHETETYALKGFQKKITKLAEKFLISYADNVITVSDSIADEYQKLYAIEKPALVLNTPSYKEVKKYDKFREVFNIEEKTIFLYQGALTKNRGVELLIEVFKTLDDNKSVMVFMGYGELESYIKEASEVSSNIFFHKAVSPEILLEYTASADFGISTIEDSCLSYRYCLPNKLFEYIMAEVPIIVSDLPEMSKIVKENGIGVVVEEESVQGTIEAIKKALLLDREKISKHLKIVKSHYNWEEQEKVLLSIYKELKG